MNSMTGYGRGECVQDGNRITVELSSVNRKSGEVSLSLPRELEALESQIRDEILRRLSRGRVTARVSLQTGDGFKRRGVRVNVELARSIVAELDKLNATLPQAAPISLDQLTRIPGVVESVDEETDPETHLPAVKEALGQALDGIAQMRATEGAALKTDMELRLKTVHDAVERIRAIAPEVPEKHRQNLRARLEAAGLENIDLGDERILKELVIFADRSDISEELTRLDSHFRHYDEIVGVDEPVGRKLDFLCQEINREVNTIGSKAQDSRIAREVVLAKTELEKFREQVQNIE
jgi:uncharacterized protein (TIGR00255 family)